jgi:hypothetical protein
LSFAGKIGLEVTKWVLFDVSQAFHVQWDIQVSAVDPKESDQGH